MQSTSSPPNPGPATLLSSRPLPSSCTRTGHTCFCYGHADRSATTAVSLRSVRAASSIFGEVAALGDGFDGVVKLTLGLSAFSALVFGALPLIIPSEKKKGNDDELDEDIQWTVSGVISCIPFVNWVGWIQVALASEEPTPFYVLAALYAAPFLRSGFNLDGFSIFMLVLGIIHIQVERVVQTEPNSFMGEAQNLNSITMSKANAALKKSISNFQSLVASRLGALDEDKHPIKPASLKDEIAEQTAELRKDLEGLQETTEVELELFDEKLRDREKRKNDA